jgi:hypothetical protein
MTTPAELDHEAGARFLEKLLAEDPAKLDAATDEQVDAMMDAAGIEAGTPETAEELLARVERRRRERRAGADERVVAAPAGTPRTRAQGKAGTRVAWVAGAVVAAAAAAGVAVEVATSAGGPLAIGPDPGSTAATARERATRLRDEAVAACGAEDYATCTAKLDDAMRLDPAGESEPRVVAARAAIAAWQMPKPAPSESTPPKAPRLK